MIGAIGFEPTTSRSQTERTSQTVLRPGSAPALYTPKCVVQPRWFVTEKSSADDKNAIFDKMVSVEARLGATEKYQVILSGRRKRKEAMWR